MLLATVLTVATCLESLYGTRAVHVLVYGTPWFAGVLFLLGLNVLCAALIRYPWKKGQTGFVFTHLGIITLLLGSVVTQKFGVDANMPVTENAQENEVILNDLVLLVADETTNTKQEFPISESYRQSSSRTLTVDLGDGHSVEVDGFIPRAVAERKISLSPIENIGSPAIKVELFNSRFNLEESLLVEHPNTPTEVNLGPALISFQVLSSKEDQERFFKPKKMAAKESSSVGYLVATIRGKEYRVSLSQSLKGFVGFDSGKFEVKVDNYFPYAVVENNQLISRSDEPVNPAVHLTLRSKVSGASETTEKHTIFANFPEFSTLHGAHGKKTNLGVKFRLEVAQSQNTPLAIVGNQRGLLAFAQSSDGTKLFYKTQGKDGQIKAQGEVRAGVTVPTGWMDLQFKVEQWLPKAVEQNVPRAIEYISGSGDNYLTAIHLREKSSGEKSVNVQSPGWWLFEGQGKLISLGGREFFIQFSKKKLALPFYLFLEKFKIGTDPGTSKAASYESDVIAKDPKDGVEKRANISMNEPFKYGGYTFYQASYALEDGKPPVSVFAVNFDPGRQIKYLGSLIMVFGILMMFYMNPHYLALIFKRKGQQK